MSQENVELAQKAFAHFEEVAAPDWSLLDEEIEIYDHDLIDAGPYRGHQGYVRWLQDWLDAWSDSSMESEEFIDAGDRVVAVLRMRATGRVSGITVERQDAMVYGTRGGAVVRIDYFNTKQQALKVVGLEE